MRMHSNPWRYNTPPGWNDINSAPRDGTVIEIQNNWGVAPHFGLCRWDYHRRGWVDAGDGERGMMEGPHLSWRPYVGDPAAYVDPTHGAQNTKSYWLHAAGRPDLAMAEAFAAAGGTSLMPGAETSVSVWFGATEPAREVRRSSASPAKPSMWRRLLGWLK